MKVKQLIQKLEKLNREAEVLLSSDSEGNYFSSLKDIYSDIKFRESKDDYMIDILDKEDIGEDWLTQKQFDKAKEAIILYP